ISYSSFLKVAHAIDAGTITVNTMSDFPPGVGAQYDPAINEIQTPPIIGRSEEGMIMHECTHAFFDLDHSAIGALEDEAAAYVVGAMYFRMTGMPQPRWNAELYEQGGVVAAGLLKQYQAGTKGIP